MDLIFPVTCAHAGLEGWTQDLDRNIINYLAHTGSLACVCKKCEIVCLARNSGRLCCPIQQFYHPQNAKLLSRREFIEYIDTNDVIPRQVTRMVVLVEDDRKQEDDDDDGDWYGLTANQYEDREVRTYWRWSCCGENCYDTGCKALKDAEDDEDTDMMINSNKEAIEEAFESNRRDECDVRRDWDDSISGDAMRGCSCGYTDGLNTYCSCGIGYNENSDGDGDGDESFHDHDESGGEDSRYHNEQSSDGHGSGSENSTCHNDEQSSDDD